MMKQYPYRVTYRLPTLGNRRLTEDVKGSCAVEAKKVFEASKPSAKVTAITPLPQN